MSNWPENIPPAGTVVHIVGGGWSTDYRSRLWIVEGAANLSSLRARPKDPLEYEPDYTIRIRVDHVEVTLGHPLVQFVLSDVAKEAIEILEGNRSPNWITLGGEEDAMRVAKVVLLTQELVGEDDDDLAQDMISDGSHNGHEWIDSRGVKRTEAPDVVTTSTESLSAFLASLDSSALLGVGYDLMERLKEIDEQIAEDERQEDHDVMLNELPKGGA